MTNTFFSTPDSQDIIPLTDPAPFSTKNTSGGSGQFYPSMPGAYYGNYGYGTFPIFSSIADVNAINLGYIVDFIILLPGYQLIVYEYTEFNTNNNNGWANNYNNNTGGNEVQTFNIIDGRYNQGGSIQLFYYEQEIRLKTIVSRDMQYQWPQSFGGEYSTGGWQWANLIYYEDEPITSDAFVISSGTGNGDDDYTAGQNSPNPSNVAFAHWNSNTPNDWEGTYADSVDGTTFCINKGITDFLWTIQTSDDLDVETTTQFTTISGDAGQLCPFTFNPNNTAPTRYNFNIPYAYLINQWGNSIPIFSSFIDFTQIIQFNDVVDQVILAPYCAIRMWGDVKYEGGNGFYINRTASWVSVPYSGGNSASSCEVYYNYKPNASKQPQDWYNNSTEAKDSTVSSDNIYDPTSG